FDNGVQRTNTGPNNITGSDALAFGSPTTLYGTSFDTLTKMTVDSNGVSLAGTSRFSGGSGIVFDNGLLYGASGQVISPATGAIVGTFTNAGSSAAPVIDAANGRAFFISNPGSSIQIRA